MCRGELSIVDLQRVLQADTGLSTEQVLAAFGVSGYVRESVDETPLKKPVKNTIDRAPVKERLKKVEKPWLGELKPRYWAVVRRETHRKTPVDENTVNAEPLVSHDNYPPAPLIFEVKQHEIASRLLGIRRGKTLGQEVSDARTLLDCWTKDIAQAKSLRPVYRCLSEAPVNDVWVICDYSDRLMLFWPQFHAAIEQLQHRFGRANVRLLNWHCWQGDLGPLDQSHTPSVRQRAVIILLSDLGAGGDTQEQQAWNCQRQAWQSAGANVEMYYPALAGIDSKHTNSTCWLPVVQLELMACLSAVFWCSPDLLLAWCLRLGGKANDAYQVWHHDEVWQSANSCGLLHRKDQGWQRLFQHFDRELQSELLGMSESWRNSVSDRERIEESLLRSALNYPLTESQTAELTQVLEEVTIADESVEQKQWLWRLAQRQNELTWLAAPRWHDACLQATEQMSKQKGGGIELGPGMQPRPTGGTKATSNMEVDVYLDDDQLLFQPRSQRRDGVIITQLSASENGVFVHAGGQQQSHVPIGGLKKLHEALDRLIIEASEERLELSKIQSPSWSIATSSTNGKLTANTDDERTLRWRYPGESQSGVEPLLAGQSANAAWVDEAQWDATELYLGVPVEQDQYGYYYDLVIPGTSITQRMRWIPPGRFTMGSPLDEAERNNDETQHPVTLSQGYWLADTACTQALWTAVTGKNPSRFKSKDNPVENIDWNDIQYFLKRTSEKLPQMPLQLPTEAQWEYACRAGSHTAFSWGDSLSAGQARYDYSKPYNNGLKGDRPSGTVGVTAFEPNDWGLHQMHGNVWESCNDWYGEYAGSEALDPRGRRNGSLRVLRGGGWIGDGGWLRSAQRGVWQPDGRVGIFDDGTGFRFSQAPLTNRRVAHQSVEHETEEQGATGRRQQPSRRDDE